MALVSVTNVEVLDNPAQFLANFRFEITFECIAPLANDIEWKLIYVGSAESEQHDQELDSILVGPIPVGLNKFVFEAPHPDYTKLPDSEIIGVTVVLITCSYQGAEFVRIGYYVNNDYADPALREIPPEGLSVQDKVGQLQREILANKPRVTRYNINWDAPVAAASAPGFEQQMQQQQQQMQIGGMMGGMVGLAAQPQANPLKQGQYAAAAPAGFQQDAGMGLAPMEA